MYCNTSPGNKIDQARNNYSVEGLFCSRRLGTPSSQKLESVDDLNRLRFEDFDVGYSIGASLAHYLMNCLSWTPRAKVLSFYSTAVGFYLAVDKVIAEHHIDYAYVFNGRFALSRALFRAFKKHSLPVFTHDRGSSYKKYTIYDNALPHDIDGYTKRVNAFWEDGQDTRFKERKAAEYFQTGGMGKRQSLHLLLRSKQRRNCQRTTFCFGRELPFSIQAPLNTIT